MDNFLEKIDEIQEQQQKLTEYNQHLKKLITDSNKKKDIILLIEIFNKSLIKLKEDIFNLKETIKVNDAFFNTKQTQYRNVIRRFYEELNIFKEIQLKEQEIEEIKLREDYLIVYPNATDKEIKNYIKNGSNNEKLFNESGFLNKKIIERHELINKLSKDVLKIVNLINEIKEGVVDRKIDIEMIEIDVNKTVKNTEHVKINLEGALKKQKLKNKFWKWIACLIGLVLLSIFLYIIIKALINYMTKSS